MDFILIFLEITYYMLLLYRIALFHYQFFIKMAALFNPKAKKWVEGRRGLFEKIASEINHDTRHVWFHFASLGEFEQGRPVLEKYKKEWPENPIVITFFSPSGYEIRKHYGQAKHVYYLPIDSPRNARRLIELFNPITVFFTKYDYWYYYFRECHRREIPLYMISSLFRETQVFFKWYGGLFRRILRFVTHFFVQNQASVRLLQKHGYNNVSLSGDTRFDRVVQVAKSVRDLPVISFFASEHRVMIAGSTWPMDVDKLQAFHQVFSEWKLIIAPHEITPASLRSTCELFPNAVLFSELSDYLHTQKLRAENHKKNVVDMDVVYKNRDTVSDHIPEHKARVLIIDNIGMLSSLYGYGDIAYVGGGFGVGIHNILEAAAYGMPVIFGPNYRKFEEAKDLIQAKAAFSIRDDRELVFVMEELMDYQVRLEAGRRAHGYVHQQAGATGRIIRMLKEVDSGMTAR